MMSAPKSSGQRPKNRGQETFVESKAVTTKMEEKEQQQKLIHYYSSTKG